MRLDELTKLDKMLRKADEIEREAKAAFTKAKSEVDRINYERNQELSRQYKVQRMSEERIEEANRIREAVYVRRAEVLRLNKGRND